MSRVVRQSKYRHVFGTPFKPELCFQDVRVQTSAWDSDYIKVNSNFWAVSWQTGGGGSLAVVKHNNTGKLNPATPCLSGHTAAILDFDFNPFNDFVVATSSEDTTVKIWGIPEDGLTETITTPLVNLDGHQRKVGLTKFHNTASNLLTTAALDMTIKLWDIENAACKFTIGDFKDAPLSLDYNLDGSLMAVTSKDKMLRVVDPRQQQFVAEVAGHQGTKGSRVVWMKNFNKLFTVGFSKMSERQYMIWDPRNLTAPLNTSDIDVASGVIMPFYDEDTSMMFLAGKGDGNIRYYEMVDDAPFAHFLTEHKSSDPQRGMAMFPKYACDTSSCEVVRLYKLGNTTVQPIMFQVPRKAETFQEDIYPDTIAPVAALSLDEWCSGKNEEPKKTSMRPSENKFAGAAPKMSDFKPKVEYKPKEQLPPKSTDPKVLMQQNDDFRKKIEELEKENEDLRKKLAALSAK